MTGANRILGASAVALLWMAPAQAGHAQKPTPRVGAVIEIWVRGERAADGGHPGHEHSRWSRLDQLSLITTERYDAQYERVCRYRGIPLNALLAAFLPAISLDLAILHFANGMAIPMPFRDEAVMKRLDPFIARASRPQPRGNWQVGTFPPIAPEDERSDRRPIEFSGNKVVVTERWHPDLESTSKRAFSPWTHADTLISARIASSVTASVARAWLEAIARSPAPPYLTPTHRQEHLDRKGQP